MSLGAAPEIPIETMAEEDGPAGREIFVEAPAFAFWACAIAWD